MNVAITLSVTQMENDDKNTQFRLENNSLFFIGFVKTLIEEEVVNTRSKGEG